MEFIEPDWISLEPRNRSVFDVLLSFVNNASLDPANMSPLVNSTTTMLCAQGTQNASADEYRFESRVLFAILLTIVKQVNAAAVQQDYLIKLVLSLRHVPLPARVAEEIDPQAMDNNMNEDLKKLINVWANFEWDAPLYPCLEDRPGYTISRPKHDPWRLEPGRCLTAEEWTNLNAFLARLHTAAPDITHLDLRGLFAMIEALEQPLTPTPLDDVLPAAACWIVYAGKILQKNDIPYAGYETDGGCRRLPWSKGELWNGRHAFNGPRWEFWMQRFKVIAERGDVSETVRLAALRALEVCS